MAIIQSSVENPIAAATKRNGRLFAIYIAVLVVTALIIAAFTWFTWDSGNKLQAAIQDDADARITEAQNATKTLGIELAAQQERAAQAEERLLRLQSQQLPRMVMEEPPAAPTDGVIKVEMMYQPNDAECANFAEQVWGWLGSRGWPVVRPIPIPVPAKKVLEVLRAQPLGITVTVRRLSDKAADNSPASLITMWLLKGLGRSMHSASDTTLPEGTLRIIVMPKG